MNQNKENIKFIQDNYFLDKKVLFLLKDMEIDSQDEAHLKKWGFPIPTSASTPSPSSSQTTSHKVKSDSDPSLALKLDQVKLKETFDTHLKFEKLFNQFIESTLTNIHVEQYSSLLNLYSNNNFLSLVELLRELLKDKDGLLLYANTHFTETRENITIYNFILAALLGLNLKISDKEFKDMLLAIIFSHLFFFENNSDKIKLMLAKENTDKNSDFFFPQQWLKYTISLIQKVKLSPEFVNFVIYQNISLDGKGMLKLNKDNITIPANIMNLTRFHAWSRHPFGVSLFKHKPYYTIDIIKHKDKYEKSVLFSFLSTVGIFEPGNTLSLKNFDKILLAIVIHSRGIKRPVVKVVFDDKNQMNYSKDLIDLNYGSYEKWKIFQVNNPNKSERIISTFNKNIMAQKYSL